MKLYKILNTDKSPYHGGIKKWPLPGRWLEVKGELIPCKNGLHLCRKQDLVLWLGPTIWQVEYVGEMIECDDKLVVRKARLVHQLNNWNEKTARLFACDCAEKAHTYSHNPDKRSVEAIAIARNYANGKATKKQLDTAATAAYAAANAAARDASAATAAAAAAAAAAASASAYAATTYPATAYAAATYPATAQKSERAWQTERLFYYVD